jgi:hypothetical protein
MATETKYREVSDETQDLFNQALDNTSIPHWVEFRVFADDNAKKPVDVRKQNEMVEYATDGVKAFAIFNEEIFDGLIEDDIKIKIIDEELTRVKVDLEKGSIKVEQHDFTTNSDFLEKHGADEVLLLKLTVRSLYDTKKEREEQEKAEAREAKKKKK